MFLGIVEGTCVALLHFDDSVAMGVDIGGTVVSLRWQVCQWRGYPTNWFVGGFFVDASWTGVPWCIWDVVTHGCQSF